MTPALGISGEKGEGSDGVAFLDWSNCPSNHFLIYKIRADEMVSDASFNFNHDIPRTKFQFN